MRRYLYLFLPLLLSACSTDVPVQNEEKLPGYYHARLWLNDKNEPQWGIYSEKDKCLRCNLPPLDYVGAVEATAALCLRDDRYGYLSLNPNGKDIKPQYLYAKPFRSGYGAVLDSSGAWGYVDDRGTYYPMRGLQYAGSFYGGAALGMDAQGYVCITPATLKGEAPRRLPYGWVFDYHNGFAVYEDKGRYGFLNNKGEVAIAAQYAGATGMCARRAWVDTGKGWICITPRGRRVGHVSYAEAYGFTHVTIFSDLEKKGPVKTQDYCLAAVKLGDRWGYVDTSGRVVLEFKYEDARPFYNGMAAVKEQGMWGYIRPDGSPAFDKKQRVYFAFADGLAPAEENGKVGYLRMNGSWGIPPQFANAQPFSEGMAAVSAGGKVGFIDMAGRWIIQPQFESAQAFAGGLAPARKDGKWGYIDRKGQWVLQPQWQGAQPVADYYALAVAEGGKVGLYHRSGRWLLQPSLDGSPYFLGGKALMQRGGQDVWLHLSGQTSAVE